MRFLVNELRWAARRLRRTPGSTLAAVAVLALSTACAATVFAVARAVLFSPLPLDDPDRLVVLERRIGDETTNLHSPADLIDLREGCDAFFGVSGSSTFRASLGGAAEPTYVNAASVTADYLETLGAKPLLGKIFRAGADGLPVQPEAAAISAKLWRSHLGGDPDVLGRTIDVADRSYRVLAVMPPELSFLGVDVWIPGPQGFPNPPFPMGPELFVRRDVAYLTILGRLRADWSLNAARSALNATGRAIVEHYPADYPEVAFSMIPFKDRMVASAREHLTVLWVFVALTFLLGCLCVSGLLIGRGIARSDEDAVKLALGASRRQAAAAAIAEGLILAGFGTVLGALGSIGGIRLFVALAPPFPRSEQAGFDLSLMLAVTGTAVLAATLASLLPLARALRVPPRPLSAGAGSTSATQSRKVSWHLLLTLEVAAMVVLLMAAFLLGRRLLELNRVDLGLRAEGVVVTLLELPRNRYSDAKTLAAFYNELLDGLEALPDSESVGGALPLPFSDARMGGSFSIVGTSPRSGKDKPSAAFSTVSPGYFRALGIRIVDGRGFQVEDRRGAHGVAVINEALAKRYWPGTSPLGTELVIRDSGPLRIVGVVADVRHSLLEPEVEPRIYRSLLQNPLPAMWLAVRLQHSQVDLDAAIRRQVHEIDPAQPVPPLVSMEHLVAAEFRPVQYLFLIVGYLAGMAILITGVGLYALLSFSVRQEERALALRLALGARRGSLLRIQLRRGLLIALAGTVVGSLSSLAVTPLLERVLPAGEVPGPLLISIVAVLVLLSAGFASLIGARRVWRLRPSRVLRDL